MEFGAGWYSTTYLHELSGRTHRLVTSLETNRAWWWQFRAMHCYQHSVMHVENYLTVIPDLGNHWSVCLVDSQPEIGRRDILDRMRSSARYLVVHDTEPEAYRYYQIEETLASFPHRSDRTDEGVRTTIVSMTEAL